MNLAGNLTSALGWYSITPQSLSTFISTPEISLADAVESAVIEGRSYTTAPTSESLVAKVFVRASFDDASLNTDKVFFFSLVSPFKPTEMDSTFRGDGCRFMGQGRGTSQDKRGGYIDVVGLSCRDDRGISYELHTKGTDRLGFVADLGDFANSSVSVVEDNGSHTLPNAQNVMVRFDQPVSKLLELGRTM